MYISEFCEIVNIIFLHDLRGVINILINADKLNINIKEVVKPFGNLLNDYINHLI